LPKHRHADAQAHQAQQWHNRSSGLSEAYQPIYLIKAVISKSGKPLETGVLRMIIIIKTNLVLINCR
jgi:hypothetical protein